MIRGVIFDLDGVLVSTDEMHFRGWKQMADEEGIYFDKQINHRLRGVSRMASLAIILERSERQYTDDQKAALAERKNGYYCGFLEELTEADTLPGARETLTELRRRDIKTALASASRNAPTIIKKIALPTCSTSSSTATTQRDPSQTRRYSSSPPSDSACRRTNASSSKTPRPASKQPVAPTCPSWA